MCRLFKFLVAELRGIFETSHGVADFIADGTETMPVRRLGVQETKTQLFLPNEPKGHILAH